MSGLTIIVSHSGPRLAIGICTVGHSTNRTLDATDEHQLGDALREIDRIAYGENPGPCERWIAGQDREAT